jgi:hypothetical protein
LAAIGGKLAIANNLSDLLSVVTARANLGLGSAATHAATDFDAAGAATSALTTAETYTDGKIAAEVTRGNGTYAPLTRQVATGTGLTGGGDLSADRTLSLASIAASTLLGNNGGASAAPSGLTATQAKALLAIAASDVSGLGAAATQSVTSDPLIGDASDGNVTISTTVTLTRDMQYGTLTVSGAGTLEVAGCRVMCRTLTGSGAIQTAPSAGSAIGGVPFTATAGVYSTSSGQINQGGAGNTGAGSAGTGHNFATTLGAVGGAGGTGSSGAAGAAGAISALTATTSGVTASANIAPLQLFGAHAFNTAGATNAYSGGTGGGGGGGDGTNKGGGGGTGGYVVAVFAGDASGFTGSIHADGGAGGSPTTGNTGGGGGGGGGLAALFAHILPTGSFTMTANGGAAGVGHGTGTNGTAGTNGTTIAKAI